MNLTTMLTGMLAPLPLMVIGYMLYFPFRARKMRGAKIIAKCTATLMCVVAAFMGLTVTGQNPWVSLLFWGTVFCMLGDGLLEVHFLSGVVGFGLGHVCLIAWLLQLSGGLSWLSLPVWALAYLAAVWAFRKYLPKLGALTRIVFLLYPLVLMGMAAVAVALPVRLGVCALSVAVGGALFAVSDMFVAKGFFDKLSPGWDRFALAIYYIAVYCLALGAWLL